jgi:hypothetical protein
MISDDSTYKDAAEEDLSHSDNNNNNTRKINWDSKYLRVVKQQLADFQRQGIKPTFRGMFYTLVDLGILPKTEENYKQLNKVSVRWRESGLIPIDSFADRTRSIIKDFDDIYETSEQYIKRHLEELEYADIREDDEDEFDFSHYGYNVPLWYKQLNYVEIWLEKDAAVGTFESIVEGLQVIVVPNRGHSSVTFIHENIERLKREQTKGKKIHILYFGDEDPSGEEMDKIYKDKLTEYGIYNVNFKRWAVTKDQKERFNLQTDPDPATLEKLQKDPNRFKFMVKYGLIKYSENPDDEYVWLKGKNNKPVKFLSSYAIDSKGNGFIKHDPTKLFAVQLEAMQTPKVRAYLKALIRYLINSLYDKEIRKQVLKEHLPNNTMGLVLKEARSLVETLEIKELEQRMQKRKRNRQKKGDEE